MKRIPKSCQYAGWTIPIKPKLTMFRVIAAMSLLGLNGDKLFQQIKTDLDRGLTQEARNRLDFIDLLLALYRDRTVKSKPTK